MLKFFKKYIEDKNETGNDSAIKDNNEKIKVAVCALLLEVAYCDDEFSDDEKIKIIKTIQNRFDLNESEAKELIDTAERERDQSLDLWHYTNLINKNYSNDEKVELIEMLWEIIYADNVLDQHEDYIIHTLTKLLKIQHKQLIDAKLKAKKKN